MTDNEQNKMFLTLFELVRDQQKIVDETAMLSQALYRAIVETYASSRAGILKAPQENRPSRAA